MLHFLLINIVLSSNFLYNKTRKRKVFILNLPNKLTIFRIILVPIMVIVTFLNLDSSFLNIPITYWILNIIFIIASYTDRLDGKLARKNNQITTFGKFADPLADKILVLAAMLILVEDGNLPAWIPIIVIFREFVVSGYRLIAVEKGGLVIPANIWGKIKTVTQMIGVILMFININESNIYGACINGNLTGTELVINILATLFITISTIATIFSGWTYIKGGKDLLKD